MATKVKTERNVRKIIEDTNQIQIQLKTIEKLRKGKLTSYKLREFVEGVGGEYEFIRSILVDSGLMKAERTTHGKGYYLYSLSDGGMRPKWWRNMIIDCQKLIEECKQPFSIVTKNNHTIIMLKHKLGKRILLNREKYRRYKFGSGVYISDLTCELEVSEATIRDAIKFASKFPDLVKFYKYYESVEREDGKLTWSYIKNFLLYNHKSGNRDG